MSDLNRKSNRLIHEFSPYLQQHAHNPVDWYPWVDEALQKGKVDDESIFLSVGYSACHSWQAMDLKNRNPHVLKVGSDPSVTGRRVTPDKLPEDLGPVLATEQNRAGERVGE